MQSERRWNAIALISSLNGEPCGTDMGSRFSCRLQAVSQPPRTYARLQLLHLPGSRVFFFRSHLSKITSCSNNSTCVLIQGILHLSPPVINQASHSFPSPFSPREAAHQLKVWWGYFSHLHFTTPPLPSNLFYPLLGARERQRRSPPTPPTTASQPLTQTQTRGGALTHMAFSIQNTHRWHITDPHHACCWCSSAVAVCWRRASAAAPGRADWSRQSCRDWLGIMRILLKNGSELISFLHILVFLIQNLSGGYRNTLPN